MKRGTIAGLALAATFFGVLAWRSLAGQSVSCKVCMEFNGGQNCATASGPDSAAAARTAQNTACGTLVHGMNDAIACDNRAPRLKQCGGAT